MANFQPFTSNNNSSANIGKKRDHPLGPPSSFATHIDENATPFPNQAHELTYKNGDEHPLKRSRIGEQYPSSCNSQPVLQLHVREASVTDDPDIQMNDATELSPSPQVSASAPVNGPIQPVKKSYKNRNLNISIPPPGPTPSLNSLVPMTGVDGNEDPVTPLYQMVHTPTTAPGAPGPANPAETRRLEQSWANSMRDDDDQLSPAFPNFHLSSGGSDLDQPTSAGSYQASDYSFGATSSGSTHETSAALREMFALTASAKTPTFPPESFSLTFGNREIDEEKSSHQYHAR